jgi:hypothetical protein
MHCAAAVGAHCSKENCDEDRAYMLGIEEAEY